MKFKILHISRAVDEARYRFCIKDTNDHPELVKRLDQETDYAIFIKDETTGSCYPADGFFYMCEITAFTDDVETNQLRDELQIAIAYIKATRNSCGSAENVEEERVACWDAVISAPIMTNGRINLTDKDKTWLKMQRQD